MSVSIKLINFIRELPLFFWRGVRGEASIILLTLLSSITLHAQDYPVQSTTVLAAPYSLYLSDYSSPEGNALQVIIHLKDLDRSEYKTKLRITIEGQGIKLQTKPTYLPPPIVLQGGVPEVLTGYDLRSYLNPDNIDFSGISRQEFNKKGTLPEGFYTFKVEVLDYVRDVTVSNAGLANAWIILNDPPLINLPFNNDKVIATDPQNILFSWTPRHAASPNAAFTTQYEFTLVELYPAGRNPNDAIRSSNPIYTTQTDLTSLNYSLLEPLLIPGRQYAFRVRAHDTEGRDLFKNQGYSEVNVFQYGDACLPPTDVKASALDATRIKLTWQPQDVHTAFSLKYRKQGSASWDDQETNNNSVVIPALQAGATYEYQVGGSCGSIQGAFSDLATIKTLDEDKDKFACGAAVPTFEIKTTPLPPDKSLKIGDLIKTADFEITLDSVVLNADKSSYKGTGFAFLPWLNLASVRVKFAAIRVNEDYRVYEGTVVTIYSKSSKLVANLDLAKEKVQSGNVKTPPAKPVNEFTGADIAYQGDIKKVEINSTTGDIIITKENGTTETLPRPKDAVTKEIKDTRITDSKGDTWLIGKDGKVSQGPSTAPPDTVISNDSVNFIVQFVPNNTQQYGFDNKEYNAASYEKATIKGAEYWINWKSVETGHQDAVNVQAEGKSAFPAIVGFKTLIGESPSQPDADARQKKIIVTGKAAGETEALTAYVKVKEPGKEEQQVEVGKLNVKTYDKVRRKVYIVPVNGEKPPDGLTLATELNRIYSQAVAEWDVTIEENYTIDPSKIKGMDAEESGMLASFPEKMGDFNREFNFDRHVDSDGYYIFLVRGSESKRSGFMPFKRKYGFVFTDKTTDVTKTIAHELGHGAFRLYHTFSSEAFIAAEKSTNNLMDYNGGTTLKKYQWDFIHDPEAVNGWLLGDEEGSKKVMFKLDYSYFNIAGADQILIYLLNNKRLELFEELSFFDYYKKKSNDDKIWSAKRAFINIFGGDSKVKIGDDYELLYLVEKFSKLSIMYSVANHHDQIVSYLQSSPGDPKTNYLTFLKGIVEFSDKSTELSENLEEIYDDIYKHYVAPQSRELSTFKNTITALALKGDATFSGSGLRRLLMNISNQRMKDLLRTKFPTISNSEIAEIIKLKNDGKYFGKLDELITKLNTKDLSKVIENTDDLMIGFLKGDPSNFVQNVNVMSSFSKLELTTQAFDFLDLAGALKNMAEHKSDLSGTFSTMISLLPISGAGFAALIFQRIADDMEEDFNSTVWKSGGWNMIIDWNEKWKGRPGLPDDVVYMYYTDNKERVNPNIVPTSFIILDEGLATEIFEFRPVYVDCHFKSQMKFNGSQVTFIPDIQVLYNK